MKFYIYTLGCKVNQYESEAIAELFAADGWENTDEPAKADAIIVNSCSVTAESDAKTRQTVRRLRKAAPKAVLVLCGCYPEGCRDAARLLPEADIVCGTLNKGEIPGKVRAFLGNAEKQTEYVRVSRDATFEPMTVGGAFGRVRAALKIEDGCDSFCSYCIIPYVRGAVRSKPADETVGEVAKIVSSGVAEIVLSGIHLDKYRDGEIGLTDLLERVDKLDGSFRFRLSSIDPTYMTDENIIRLSRLNKLCRQFHMSLQSGSDRILRLMNRRYTYSEFYRSVSLITECMPDSSVTTDIITGFPGETEDDFEKSIEAVHGCRFLKTHVFPYSERPGTAAVGFDCVVPVSERKLRASRLISEADIASEAYLESRRGETAELLVENISGGRAEGFTREYIPCSVPAENHYKGELITVCLGRM